MDGWTFQYLYISHIVICLRKCPNFAVFLCGMVLRISYKTSKYTFYLKRLKRKNFMSKSWHMTGYVLGAKQGILWSRLWQFVASVSGWEKPLFLFFFSNEHSWLSRSWTNIACIFCARNGLNPQGSGSHLYMRTNTWRQMLKYLTDPPQTLLVLPCGRVKAV